MSDNETVIVKLKKLYAAAKQGTWSYVDQDSCCAVNEEHWDIFVDKGNGTGDNVACMTGDEDDVAFIVAAHNSLSSLIDEIDTLRKENKNLRRELTNQSINNEKRNKELDALHYVWCDGGCKGGTHRYCGSPDDITEDVVALLERQTTRLRKWFDTRQRKKERESTK